MESKKKKEDKKAFILGIAGFICIFAFGGWLSKNVVMDLMTGSRTVHLTQITTHQSIGRIRFYYYLSGKDGSKNYRFKISANEAVGLEDAKKHYVILLSENRADLGVLQCAKKTSMG